MIVGLIVLVYLAFF